MIKIRSSCLFPSITWFILLIAITTNAARSTDFLWTGLGDDNNWSNGDNWKPVGPPGPTDKATIDRDRAVDVDVVIMVNEVVNRGTLTATQALATLQITTLGDVLNSGTIMGAGVFGGGIEIEAGGLVFNSGTIKGGAGANGSTPGSTGVAGGDVRMTADDRIFNSGFSATIMGGSGGNAPGAGARGGNGGNVEVLAIVSIRNSGTISGGSGGDTSPLAPGTVGGFGGLVEERADEVSNLNGSAKGGTGGLGSAAPAGSRAGGATKRGNKISLNNGSEVFGGDVLLSARIELVGHDLEASGVNANSRITVDTCPSGVVDLTGNLAGEDILVAGSEIEIFSDVVLLDPGVNLSDISSPDAVLRSCSIVNIPALSQAGRTTLALLLIGASVTVIARRRRTMQ